MVLRLARAVAVSTGLRVQPAHVAEGGEERGHEGRGRQRAEEAHLLRLRVGVRVGVGLG